MEPARSSHARRAMALVVGGLLLAGAFAVGGAVASDAFFVVAGVLGGLAVGAALAAIVSRPPDGDGDGDGAS